MGKVLDSLDVSGGWTCVSLPPFTIGEDGSDGGQDIHTHKLWGFEFLEGGLNIQKLAKSQFWFYF